ncbi:hypothetical protein OSTOST_14149, partial [Ostertagia ostertagi]
MLSQVNLIAITCDSELSKVMRTDDPRRDSVVTSVREQVAVAKEIVKATLVEISEWIYVGKGFDEVVILGTNALELFNLRLSKGADTRKEPEDEGQIAGGVSTGLKARVKSRVFVPSKAMRTLTLTCARADLRKSPFLCSSHPLIPDGVCSATDNDEVNIPVINNSNQGMVFKKGEPIGEWQVKDWVKPKYVEPERDMLDLNRPRKWCSTESRIDTLMEIIEQHNTLPCEAVKLLKEFNNVFAVTDAELTQTDLVVHEIDTGDHKPIRQKTRPVPIAARKEFKGVLKDLVERGIVERSSSDWASPVVLVKKKDGALR